MLRRLVVPMRTFARRTSLKVRFLWVSAGIVTAAMLLLGWVLSAFVAKSIEDGVASTAAASVEALITNSISGVSFGSALSPEDVRRLDRIFDLSSSAAVTNLVQVVIYDLRGGKLYQAATSLGDPKDDRSFSLAASGRASLDMVDVAVAPAGPIGSHSLSLLRMYTPLHRPGDADVLAVAALYYSARSLFQVTSGVEVAVWIAVLLTGVIVTAALFAFVAAADRTITGQRRRLSQELAATRKLSEDVRYLNAVSERLRMDSIEANEQLLARVGSDIHDGPLQLLTLAILQLGQAQTKSENAAGAGQLGSLASLTGHAMSDLRHISSGLVLPELAALSLAQTISLAADRHEGATGTNVLRDFEGVDIAVSAGLQVCVYRIVQESLSNAFRHSGGMGQAVAARVVDDSVSVTISNAVRGALAPPEHSPLRPKLGIRGMQLRAEALGGTLVTEPGDTLFRVLVRLPLRQ